MRCIPMCTARMLEDACFDPEMISDASRLKVWGHGVECVEDATWRRWLILKVL